MDHYLPAEPFAHQVFLLLAQGIALEAFAASIGAHPDWVQRLLLGEITRLPLLPVVGFCRAMSIMPEDVWPPDVAARAFSDWPPDTFDPES